VSISRPVQVFTVELLVNGSLDGSTPAPAISEENRIDGPTYGQAQLYRITVEDLGLVGPDFLEGVLGSISTKYVPWIVVDGRGAVGEPGAGVDVVDFDENDTPDTTYLDVISLDGVSTRVRREGFYIYQGTALRLDGMEATGDQPIKVRFEVRAVENIEDFGVAVKSGVPSNGDAGGGVVGVVRIRGLTRTVFQTIEAALATAEPADVVLCGPGDYPESVYVPDRVILESQVRGAAHISGAAPEGTRIELGAGAKVRGFCVMGPTNSAPAIRCGEDSSQLTDITWLGQSATSTAVSIAAEDVLLLGNCGIRGGTYGRGIEMLSGRSVVQWFTLGNAKVTDALVAVDGGVLETGSIRVLGPTAVCKDAFQLNGGRYFGSDVLLLDGDVENGVHITADAVECDLRTPYFSVENVDVHLLVDAGVTTGKLFIVGGSGARRKISASIAYLSQPSVEVTFQDDQPGDQAFVFQTQVEVGSPALGRSSSFGEGDTFTRGMTILRAPDPSGPFTDITAALTLPGDPPTGLLPNTSTGSTLYVGGSAPFVGFESIVTQAMDLGAGAIVFERSNGSGGWDTLLIMVANAYFPYDQRAQKVFQAAEQEQTRLGEGLSGFAPQDVNGQTKFWWRMRVTADIDLIPLADQIQLTPNRTKLNKDGFLERSGDAENVRELLWHRRLEDDLVGSSPGNVVINFSSGIRITPIDNNFVNGATDGNGGVIPIPPGLDTSRILKYRLSWLPSNNAGGDVRFEFRYRVAAVGDLLNVAQTDTTIVKVVTLPGGEQDALQETDIDFTIPDALPGERIGIAFLRTGADVADTYAGNVEIVDTQLFGFGWQ